jgi:basic membrane protein A and related proteins
MKLNKRRLLKLLALIMGLALIAAACGDSGSDDSGDGASDDGSTATTAADAGEACGSGVVKAAFVYVGPIGDAGWTKKHDDGRLALEDALGECVETVFLESVPEGAESEAVFEKLARDGNDVIFGTSFGYMDQMLAVAERFPDVVFSHATGFKTSDNMGTYFGAAEEARYLTGIAAGAVTTTNQIGYVAAFPIPEVLRGINAFTLGAQSVNPDITVEVIWTSTWFDPVIEKEAAEALLNGGADVVAQHQDTPSAGEAAEEAGASWIGYNDDMSRFAPNAWLTAPVWDWGPYYIRTVEAVRDGTWSTEQYYGNMADGLVNIAPVAAKVPGDAQSQITDVQSQIVSGSFNVFTGPMTAQDGSEILAEGEELDLDRLFGMDFFVEGVVGSASG